MLIYKYRSLDDLSFEFTRMILDKRTIYFAPPEKLNDPLEYSYLWTTNASLADKVKFWSNQNQIYASALAGKSQEQQTADVLQWEGSMTPPRGPKMIGADQVGVFSCSDTPDSLPVWSHYADRHQGICLEFESEADEVLSKTRVVKYTDQPGEFNLYGGINHSDVLTRKYSDWSFEKEIRIFYNPGLYTYDETALKRVIFGLDAWKEDKNRSRVNELIQLVQSKLPNAILERASREIGYKLRMERI